MASGGTGRTVGRGHLPYLERAATANLNRLGTALGLLDDVQPDEVLIPAAQRQRDRLRAA
jgi:hypothetical protein